MKELPILMSTPMVQANLADLKTETRRTSGLELINYMPSNWKFEKMVENPNLQNQITGKSKVYDGYWAQLYWNGKQPCPNASNRAFIKSPYGKPSDMLWVRETWRSMGFDSDKHLMHIQYKDESAIWCKMNSDYNLFAQKKWKSSIHMPKAAARIWLQIKSIGVERLQDITGPAAAAEGIRIPVNDGKVLFKAEANSAIGFLTRPSLKSEPYTTDELLIAHYAELWCDINGRESWDANPWVWVIKYKVLSKTGKPADSVTLSVVEGQ